MATANRTLTRRTEPVAAGRGPTRVEKGVSLARGPALVLGTILLAAGLYFLYRAHSFPRWANFPNGTARKDGNFFFGIFGANGWTGELTAVAGGLLLFGAAHHILAKTMSLIVGCALGAAAIIALISGNVLGMAGANGWTELGWGVAAAILLFNSMIPRRTRTVAAEPVGAGAGLAAGGMSAREQRRERLAAEEADMAPAGGETRMGARSGAGSAVGTGMGAAAGAGAGAVGARAAEDRMAEDRTGRGGMAENEMAGGNGMTRGGMAENEMAGGNGMTRDGMGAGTGMGDDDTRLVEDRPRRFQRSDEMDGMGASDGMGGGVGAGDGMGASDGMGAGNGPVDDANARPAASRRSGGLLAGLFRRD
jgi:hypothetical protein